MTYTIKITPFGEIYSLKIPANAKHLGTIDRGNGDKGRLVKMPRGLYVQVNRGCIRNLEQCIVKTELKKQRITI
jgi:hypothetical protein